MSSFSAGQFETYTTNFCRSLSERMGWPSGIRIDDIPRLKAAAEEVLGADAVKRAFAEVHTDAGRMQYAGTMSVESAQE